MKSVAVLKKPKMITGVNSFECSFDAKSINEGFARMLVSAFVGQLDPTVADMTDLKTAVSEAVTNCIVHAYRDREKYKNAKVYLSGVYFPDGTVSITIKDKGCGIEDIKQAMEPLYTTCPSEERSGMGFTVIAGLSDKLKVSSDVGKGTTITIEKKVFGG